MSPSPPASLQTLPPEIIVLIFQRFLDPRSITRIAQTCKTLNDLARSELVWKHFVLNLVEAYEFKFGSDGPAPPFGSRPSHDTRSRKTTWWEQAKFLLPNARHLGYFASSIPFSSRIIRVAIIADRRFPGETASSPPTYTIHAAQVRPFNTYSVTSPPPPHVLPFGANLEITLDAYSVSRIHNPFHPDAGISTDVLSPCYDFSAGMIDITPAEGAKLSQPNSSTRQGIAAAALNASTTTSRDSGRQRLRLSLETTSQLVHGGSRTALPESDSGTELSREALLALFSGRLPRRSWPTLELVGIDQVAPPSTPSSPSFNIPSTRSRGPSVGPRKRLRPNTNGAFRGVEEWIRERGTQQAIARIVENEHDEEEEGPGDRNDDKAYVTGFRLRAKRRRTMSASSSLPTPPGTSSSEREPSTATLAEARVGRRGIGRNGGMAVLWNGGEDDPDETRPVTILRAGDREEGGVVLELEGDQVRAPANPQADTNGTATPSDAFADALDAAGEAFFPIKPPAKPIGWDDPTCVAEGHDVTPTSLEGMWVGTYGSHGLEFVHLSTSLTSSSRSSRPPTPSSETNSPPEAEPTTRILTATKLTGDTNVPSGETTWIAFLDEQPSAPRSDGIGRLEEEGSVPSISKEKWTRMNRLDPNSSSSSRFSNSDWFEGTTPGVGQIALSGFLQPGWTSAKVRFIRTETLVRRNRLTGEVRRDDAGLDVQEGKDKSSDVEEWDSKVVESVEEIQLRWTELNKIAVFRRVRI